MKTETYLKAADKIMNDAKIIAEKYYQLTGRPLGITGEVAEFMAVKLLGLEICDVREKGCDAIRVVGRRKYRIQIKGRVIHEKSKKSQRLGSLKKSEAWDIVLLVLLSSKFDVVSIYEARRDVIIEALEIPGSKARNVRGQLSVSRFKAISRQIWPTP